MVNRKTRPTGEYEEKTTQISGRNSVNRRMTMSTEKDLVEIISHREFSTELRVQRENIYQK